MKRKRILVSTSILGATVVALGCTSSPAGNDAGSDSSGGIDSAEDVRVEDSGRRDSGGQDSGGQDAGGQDSGNESSTMDSAAQDSGDAATGTDGGPVNGCTSFTDLTASSAVITGPTSYKGAQYSPNCLLIKAGQSVTWNSAFANHPLMPWGGATPNPVTPTSTGTTVTFAFPTPGIYGYHCKRHTTIMFGAIEVTP